ncbi:MAG: hypothetical protein WC273_00790 [Dehalococcoidia bacterium]
MTLVRSGRGLRSLILGLTAMAATVAVACGGDSTTKADIPPAPTATVETAPTGPNVSVAKVASIGDVLVDPKGMTLYISSEDTSGKSNCTGNCAANWLPLKAFNGVAAKADGVPGELGVITRADGVQQISYKGMPLYRYAGDSAAGEAKGITVMNWAVAAP